MYKLILLFSFSLAVSAVYAQRMPDEIYMNDIHSVKMFPQNNQLAPAILSLNSGDQVELHFDDVSGAPKNFYYTYQLCNADWSPADISVFDYLKGFVQNRVSQYRMSTVSTNKYVHYQALLPERSCVPVKSGNYLVKVFLDADTSKLAFTKRLLIVDNKVSIAAKVQQPFDPELLRSHQKVQFSVNTQQLNLLNAQQAKVVILQNARWDNAISNIQPSFIRGNLLEYNAEQDCLFPAGKEYRWADLQSFRFESERIDRVDRNTTPITIYIKQDLERTTNRYAFYRDRNGWADIGTDDYINPWWQSEYAQVIFTFTPANNQPLPGKNVYLFGELTGNVANEASKMIYDSKNGVYQKMLLLKQVYYSYTYVTKDERNRLAKPDFSFTEGNYWETENDYTILFYYRSFSGRYDELIGISSINSRNLGSGF
jgi:hypothetical protein